MPAAPNPVWIVAAYYGAQFLFGVLLNIKLSEDWPGLLGLGVGGLWWLFVTNIFFFMAPWIHQSWVAPVILILIPTSIVLAWWRLKGWVRLIAIIALLLCLNAYSVYVVALTEG
jgi:hypothetical protein